MQTNEFLNWPIYSFSKEEKRTRLEELLHSLTVHHSISCNLYENLLAARDVKVENKLSLEKVPFFPVRLFKLFHIQSINNKDVFKVLTSSGTTGQVPSKIFLDKETSNFQTHALVKIVQEFLGKNRLPMLIIDHPNVIKDRNNFSARGAGILGLSNFGREHVYALNEDMSLNIDAVNDFCERHKNTNTFVFGFTFIIWQNFVLELERLNFSLNLQNSIFLHSGGWKKLQDIAVDNFTFKERLNKVCGVKKIHNFYGMVEQVGSIFVECIQGYLHTPAFAEILVRDPLDWSIKPNGEMGVVQVLSCIPKSYPGHSLLTEDLGTIHGEDNCKCGRLGKYFEIHGRIPRAEVRGCSDTQVSPTK